MVRTLQSRKGLLFVIGRFTISRLKIRAMCGLNRMTLRWPRYFPNLIVTTCLAGLGPNLVEILRPNKLAKWFIKLRDALKKNSFANILFFNAEFSL